MSSRVGQLLIENGLITQEQLQKALEMVEQNNSIVNTELVKLGAVEEDAIVNALGKEFGLPIVDLGSEEN